MKRILMAIPAAMLLSCGTSKSSQSSSTTSASRSNNTPESTLEITGVNRDTLILTGTQYIPIEGRSETGTAVNLEGAWELVTLNGQAVGGGIKQEILDSIKKFPPGTELRRDSLTTIDTSGGVRRTVTEINYDIAGTPEKRITPQQGSNYHIPEKPRISFFGSNETFSGFTGCNKMAGRYKITGKDSISLQNATASTKMVCIGEFDEDAFLSTLHRVKSFKSENGQLHLMEGDKVLMVFTRKPK